MNPMTLLSIKILLLQAAHQYSSSGSSIIDFPKLKIEGAKVVKYTARKTMVETMFVKDAEIFELHFIHKL
jgi:hypothetical protein